MVEMMMCDEHRIDGIQRHAGTYELKDDAAAGVEQDVLVADADERGRGIALRIRPRPAGSEEDNFHHAWHTKS
jgi:hypothetical protein